MDLESETCPDGFWPVFKGESFDIWTPEAGEYYAFADPDVVIPWLLSNASEAGTAGATAPTQNFRPHTGKIRKRFHASGLALLSRCKQSDGLSHRPRCAFASGGLRGQPSSLSALAKR